MRLRGVVRPLVRRACPKGRQAPNREGFLAAVWAGGMKRRRKGLLPIKVERLPADLQAKCRPKARKAWVRVARLLCLAVRTMKLD